ncbi:MAG: hypothetical protein ACJ8F7_16540 [Gemmataceae bacterium]
MAVKDWQAFFAGMGVMFTFGSLTIPLKSACDVSNSPQTMMSGIAPNVR